MFWLGFFASALVLCGLAAAAQETSAGRPQPSSLPIELHINPQPLVDALTEFARQAGLQLLLDADEAAQGKNAPPLSGTYTPENALKVLLANASLYYEFLDPRTVAIRSTKSSESAGWRRTSGAQRERLEGFRLAQARAAGSGSDGAGTAQASPAQDIGKNAANEPARVDEVIVTATKRAERVEDIPLSIAVVSSEDIERRGLVNSEDYLRGIPGVNQTNDTFGQGIVIRGMETQTSFQNFTGGGTTAIYFGETSTTNSGGLTASTAIDIKLVDIARVEVLRGPQGTAFGNSSLGGAVRTIPMAPKLDVFEGKVAAGYSSTAREGGDNHQLQGVINIPVIADRVAVRAVAYQFDDSGYYRNVAGSDPAAQASAASYNASAFAVNRDDIGASRATGGRFSALIRASDSLKFNLSWLKQKFESDGYAVSMRPGYDQTMLQAAPEDTRRGESGGLGDNEIQIGNAMAEYDLGWGDLLATYSHVKAEAVYVVPFSGNPFLIPAAVPVSSLVEGPHRMNSGEIRLATKLDGAWNVLAGIYAEKLNDEYSQDLYWYGSDLSQNYYAPGQRYIVQYHGWRTLKQRAAFGELSWRPLPRLTLTGGARAYRYERTTDNYNTGPLVGGLQIIDQETDESGTSFRGAASYKLTENALLYASYADGFRLGRTQAAVPASRCDINGDGVIDNTNVTVASTAKVDSDTVESYELGAKGSLFDRRMQVALAVFRSDWSGLPFLTSAPGTIGCPTWTANAGTARSEGVELQVNTVLNQAWRIDTGMSWIDARLTEDVPAQGFKKGMQLPGGPRFNANLGLEYGFNVREHRMSVRADAIYIGTLYTALLQQPIGIEAGDYVKLDLSARMEISKLSLDLYVRNATNADDFYSRSHFTTPNVGDYFGYRLRPRTVGLQLSYDF